MNVSRSDRRWRLRGRDGDGTRGRECMGGCTFFTSGIQVNTLGQMVHVGIEATWLDRERRDGMRL